MSLLSRTACRSSKPAGWLMTNLVFLLCGRLKIAALKGVRAPRSTHLRFIPALESKHLRSSNKVRQAVLTFALQRDSTSPSPDTARYNVVYVLFAPTLGLSSKVPFNHDPAVGIRPGPRQLWYVRTTRAITLLRVLQETRLRRADRQCWRRTRLPPNSSSPSKRRLQRLSRQAHPPPRSRARCRPPPRLAHSLRPRRPSRRSRNSAPTHAA